MEDDGDSFGDVVIQASVYMCCSTVLSTQEAVITDTISSQRLFTYVAVNDLLEFAFYFKSYGHAGMTFFRIC